MPAMQETRVRSLGQEDSPGEAHGNPVWYSCLENSTDRGAWWATVHGATKSQTQLSDFTSITLQAHDLQFPLQPPPDPSSSTPHLHSTSHCNSLPLAIPHPTSSYTTADYFLPSMASPFFVDAYFPLFLLQPNSYSLCILLSRNLPLRFKFVGPFLHGHSGWFPCSLSLNHFWEFADQVQWHQETQDSLCIWKAAMTMKKLEKHFV